MYTVRTNGKNAYATPSEYVSSLIRIDMEKESESMYVFRELLKSAEDIKRRMAHFLDSLD